MRSHSHCGLKDYTNNTDVSPMAGEVDSTEGGFFTYGCIPLLLPLAYVNKHNAFSMAKIGLYSLLSALVWTEWEDELRAILRSTLERKEYQLVGKGCR